MQIEREKGWILFNVILIITLAQLNSDIFLPSMPAMVEALNASVIEIQRIVVYATIAFGVALLAWGPLSDHYGRRPVALAGLTLFAAGSLVCALAPTLNALLMGRIIQGIGISCTGALAPVIPKDIFSGKSLLRAFSYISMAMAIIPIGAQILGGTLQALFSWRANFIVLMGYGLCILMILTKFLPETNPKAQRGRLPVKQVLQQYWSVATDPIFLGFLGCLVFVLTAEMLYTIVSPFWLQMELGLSAIENGMLSIFTGAGLFLGAWLSSRLAATKDVPGLLKIGIAILMLASLLMWAVTAMGWYTVWSLVLPFSLFNVGAGFIYPNAIAGIINRYPDQAGIAGALMSALQMALAGALSGQLRLLIVEPRQLALYLAGLVLLVLASFCLTQFAKDDTRRVPES